MAESPIDQVEEVKERKRINFWLKIFSKRPVYIIFNMVLVITIGIIGFVLINCWTKTKDFEQMLICATGGSYVSITETIAEEDNTTGPDNAEFWKKGAQSRFTLPEGRIIEEDIEDLEAYWYQQYGGLVKLLLIIFLLTFLVFYEIYKFYRRKFFFRLEDESQVGYLWSIKGSSEDLQLYREKEFEKASFQLRQSASGQPAPDHPPYLVLIERKDKEDHMAMLYDQMLFDLAKRDIQVDRYFFEDDPRLVYKEKYKSEHHFSYLTENYPNRKLIIVGEAKTFFDSLTDRWDAWTKVLEDWEEKDIIVMTPKNPLSWGHREIVLSKRYPLLPANFKGIAEMPSLILSGKTKSLRYWVEENEYPSSPDLEAPDLIEELKVYFDTYYDGLEEHYQDGKGKYIFQWLCATAIYAEINWDMTLALGHALEDKLGEPLVTPQNLYILSSLSWFRNGKIPERSRSILVGQLDKENTHLVRQTLIRLLKSNEPPSSTYAHALHQLRLAVQEAQLKPSIRRHLRVVQLVQDFTLNHDLNDPTILNYLNKYPRAIPKVSLPSTVSDMIFENGAPALGMQSWVRMVLGSIVVIVVLLTVNPNSLDKVYTFRGKDYFIADDEARMRFHTYRGNTYLQEGKLAEAKKEYEQAVGYKEVINAEEYLAAAYNLNFVKLKEGNYDEAESGFDQVATKVDELLADNSRRGESKASQKVEDVKSATNYIRGKIEYESGDIDAAAENFTETMQNNTTRVSKEATYAKGLISLEKAMETKGIDRENKIRLALNKFEEVSLTDTTFFSKETYALKVLDSLADKSQNEAFKQRIKSAVKALREGKIIPSSSKDQTSILDSMPSSGGKGIVIRDAFTYLTDFRENKALVKTKEGLGFAGMDGKLVSKRLFEDARLFHNGLAAVKQNGKWGFINEDFETLIPFEFANARDFQEGFASVKKGKSWGLINREGETALAFRYERPLIFDPVELRPQGAKALAVVQRGEGYQFIDREGKVAFGGATFRFARNFRGERARVKRWGKVFEIDRRGNCISASVESGECPSERWRIQDRHPIEEHRKEVNVIHYSPNGRLLLTASKDSTAKLWGANGKQLLSTLTHPGNVVNAEFSPKNDRIATIAEDGKIYIWTTEGAKIKTFDQARAPLLSLAWSPGGQWLVGGSQDGKVLLFNMTSLVFANRFDVSSFAIRALSFSPNNFDLAIGGLEKDIQIWGINGRRKKVFRFGSPVNALDYSPDGQQLAVASRDSAIYIFNGRGERIRKINGHSDWVSDVEFSPDGEYLMSSSFDRSLRVWNSENQAVLAVTKAGTVSSATFSPDGRFISCTYFAPKGKGKALVYRIAKF